MQKTDFETSPEALFRYQVISQVLSRVATGEHLSKAVQRSADMTHSSPMASPRKVSKRSIYRWLKAYKENGFDGLLPKARIHTQDSLVLDPCVLEFFAQQKKEDPRVSIPELINRGKILGLISPWDHINRVTVWRALNRMGIDTSHRKSLKNRDSRRFAYPHRMDMVLCDGKHFRAGVNRVRRVALFFLDDCTRMILNVVVGTSESTSLFMRGLYETIKTYGFMSALFTDWGPGFKSYDSIDVIRKLDILFIHGAKGYPQGRGKLERFNRTVFEQAIRFFNGNPEIDPDCISLQQRLRHYVHNQYANTIHEKLDKKTPRLCFQNDTKALRFAQDLDHLRQAFVLYTKRRVSFDNVVSFKGIAYEVPRGYAGTRITLLRNILEGSVSICHQGRVIQILPVDLHANARQKRATGGNNENQATDTPPPKSCSQINYERDFQPVVDSDGGFITQSQKKEESCRN